MRLPLVLALAAGLSSAAWAVDSDGTRPDDKLTPGEVRTTDRAEICATRTGTVRDVSEVMKIAARRNYGLMNNRAGWCAPNGCEVDHRVLLEIGGDNRRGSIANLWPEKATGPNNFHDKDRCENAAHKAICDGFMSVADAQAIFLGDWVAGCAALMGSR